MIDTATMGIRKIFNIQKNKFFPLPDYDLSNNNEVAVTVYGKILNENYTRLLFDNRDFDLNTVFLLDKVQKGEIISKENIKYLRKLSVIEGKVPNIFVSAKVAKIVGGKAKYIQNKAFDDEYYKNLIINYLEKFEKAKKSDITDLLFNKLPDVLNDNQKNSKIKNLLTSLKKSNKIIPIGGNSKNAYWVLFKNEKQK